MQARQTTTTRGALAEERAAAYLMQQGLHVLVRNWRVRGGEIDLICREGETLVFVEVRLRKNRQFGGAAESITATKQARIVLAARHYLAGKPEQICRFDVVLLDDLETTSPEWIRHAFLAE